MSRSGQIVSALILLLCPSLLTAQTVVTAPPPLDAVHVRVRDAIQELEDSLQTVTSAAARVQRDLRQASSALLQSRAREVRDGCRRSAKIVAPTSNTITQAGLPDPDPRHQRAELLEGLRLLQGNLEKCAAGFDSLAAPSQVPTMKGYGAGRALRVTQAVKEYEASLQVYLGAAHLRLRSMSAARN